MTVYSFVHPETYAIQVSQYGLYDELSDAMKKFVDGLHAVHTSRLQCEQDPDPPASPLADWMTV